MLNAMSDFSNFGLYLIHCPRYADRLAPALEALSIFDRDVCIIDTHNGYDLSCSYIQSVCNSNLWTARVSSILDILLSNAGQVESFPQEAELNREWLRMRELTPGEVSVLSKHYTALLMLANSKFEYGFIFEDDVRVHHKSAAILSSLFNCLSSNDLPDYFDVVGGCGLHPTKEERLKSTGNILVTLDNARTRTNAGYAVSRTYARRLVDVFLPFVVPIDWHYQCIFRFIPPKISSWLIKPLLLHGSEVGLVQSWRQPNV